MCMCTVVKGKPPIKTEMPQASSNLSIPDEASAKVDSTVRGKVSYRNYQAQIFRLNKRIALLEKHVEDGDEAVVSLSEIVGLLAGTFFGSGTGLLVSAFGGAGPSTAPLLIIFSAAAGAGTGYTFLSVTSQSHRKGKEAEFQKAIQKIETENPWIRKRKGRAHQQTPME